MRKRHLARVWVLGAMLIAAAAGSACGDGAARRQAEAARARAQAEEAEARARANATAEREALRLAALWNYHNDPAGAGRWITAAINSTDDVETGGEGARRVQLVFRDHPEWGRTSYLVLQAGDFDCYRGCKVAVTVDDREPVMLAARRPRTDEAIAMFIIDWQALWRATGGAKRVSIAFPVTAGGTRAASFDVAGLDREKMPGWDALLAVKER